MYQVLFFFSNFFFHLENCIIWIKGFLFFNDSNSLLFADIEGVFTSINNSYFKGFNRRKSNLEVILYREKNTHMKTKFNPSKYCSGWNIDHRYIPHSGVYICYEFMVGSQQFQRQYICVNPNLEHTKNCCQSQFCIFVK